MKALFQFDSIQDQLAVDWRGWKGWCGQRDDYWHFRQILVEGSCPEKFIIKHSRISIQYDWLTCGT